MNLYTYCDNNPILGVDPSGHNPVAIALGVGAILAASVYTIAVTQITSSQTQSDFRSGAKAISAGCTKATSAVETAIDNVSSWYSNNVASQKASLNSIYDAFSSEVSSPYLRPWISSMTISEAYAQTTLSSDVTTDSKTKTQTSKQKKTASYTVYKLIDEDENVQYIGRTGDVEATIRRHKRNIFRSELTLVPINQGLTFEQSRALEQYYIETYRTLNKENKANNQINGVNPKKIDKYNYYADIAAHYLAGETYVGG